MFKQTKLFKIKPLCGYIIIFSMVWQIYSYIHVLCICYDSIIIIVESEDVVFGEARTGNYTFVLICVLP